MDKKHVVLKPGKEKAILNRHHWIFSGAIQSMPAFEDGEILPVHSACGLLLGHAYFNRLSSIAGRMVAFGSMLPWQAIELHLKNAIELRRHLFHNQNTNAFRLVNGEGDCLPGLIIDNYNGVLVMQISTLGMESLRPRIVEHLISEMRPEGIYEKSLMPSRKEEGLKPVQKMLFGKEVNEVEVIENGLRFLVSITEGQKTGFFIDHREMRSQVRAIAARRKVLNCFCYTGAFSAYALAGGANQVDSIDISSKAIDSAKTNLALNGFSESNAQFHVTDAFEFLREQDLQYDLIILDPPAFAKKKKDIIPACRGYKDINRLAMQKMLPKSILLTCSCSHHIDFQLFTKVIFQASVEAKRTVKIIGTHRMAADHPINVCHPESEYLKSLLLYVE